MGGLGSRRAGCAALAGMTLLALAACTPAPIPVQQAEKVCLGAAYNSSAGPRTEVGFGVGNHGFRGGYVSVGMSGDQLMGRDPSEVYARCVMSRSGQMPTRPLYEQPGWAGK